MRRVHVLSFVFAACTAIVGDPSDGGLSNPDANFDPGLDAGGVDSGAEVGFDAGPIGCGTFVSRPETLDAGLPPLTFSNWGRGLLTLEQGQERSVDGVTLSIAATGDLRVADGAGTVLWHSDTKATCNGKCRLVFQGDGNLVLLSPSGAYWSSRTSEFAGAVLTLSNEPPWLSIRDDAFAVAWPLDAGAPANIEQTRRDPHLATPVRALLDSMGINSHVNQSGLSAAVMWKMLDYLNVKHLRDGWRNDGSLLTTWQALASHGISWDLPLHDPYAQGALTGARAMAALSPGKLIAVEGPNEINNFPFSCNGVVSQKGWPNDAGVLAQCFMTKAFADVHADPQLAGVALYDLTWGGTENAEAWGLLDLDGRADLGNMHYYPRRQPSRQLLSSFAGLYHHVYPPQAVITETGVATTDVSRWAQAVIVLNTWLSAFEHGFARTWMYELYDEWEDYGLFDKTFAPKPAATAVHALTTVLMDSGDGPAPVTRLNWSATGLPPFAHSVLLSKSNGTLALVLWNEAEVSRNGVDLPVVPATVQVMLGATFARVETFSLLDSELPTQTASCVDKVTFEFGAGPVVLLLTP